MNLNRLNKSIFKITLVFLFNFLFGIINAQGVDSSRLDELFNSLEERNEAMGSIAISKNGRLLYSRAIGFKFVLDDKKAKANIETKYRIWSITKMFTATMIMQLVEEGKLNLDTKLDYFFPEILNAKIITIKNMLSHQSGLHDFANYESEVHPTSEGKTKSLMIKKISQFKSDFLPGESYQYSNSNFLLLGYIIEKIDGMPYSVALSNRISSKIILSNTYFGAGCMDSVENKSFSYEFDKKWLDVPEGDFSGMIPAGAGGIVSTPTDLCKFIDALFNEKLISKSSLIQMTDLKGLYGLGIMSKYFKDKIGLGHSGGYIASESSLFHYPQDSLTIAYCTNGIVYGKESILNHVLSIYHNEPFGVSLNRYAIFGIAVIILVLFLVIYKFFFKNHFVFLGFLITVVFWIMLVGGGILHGNYNHLETGIGILNSFYSQSGTLMSVSELLIAFLTILFMVSLYRGSKKIKISIIPMFPIIFIIISFGGQALFSEPNSLYPLFANSVIPIIFGPLLALFLWRKKMKSKIKWLLSISLLILSIAIAIFIFRPHIPLFGNNYQGLIQKFFYLGWSIWFISLSINFRNVFELDDA